MGGSSDQALVFGTSGWTLQTRNPVIPNSGFARSTEGQSHYGDTSVWYDAVPSQAAPTQVDVYLTNAPAPVPISPKFTPVGGFFRSIGYDPSRPRVLVAAATNSASSNINLYLHSLVGNAWAAPVSLGISYPPKVFWAVGINEDGNEARVTYMDPAIFQGSCYTDFISLIPPYVIKRTITIPKSPSNGNCSGDGALAPRIK